ncbi:MAG TPA: cysteine desulfurase family protein [Candidatus Saccharimonadales bacterium]
MTSKSVVYLDYAAATPLDERVEAAMKPFYRDLFYNPSANYSRAIETKQALSSARAKVANIIGAKPSEIIFTAGGTEANNLAIKGLLTRFPDGNILLSAIEHDSVINPANSFHHKSIKVDHTGIIDTNDLLSKIDDKTILVSVMYVNNEIGTIQPIAKIAKVVAEIRIKRLEEGITTPILLHTDACQASNYLDLHISRLGVDMMTINGGKVYGPKQSGVLFIKAGTILKPLIDGGGQEHGLRSGTESLVNAAGFAVALEIAQKMRKDESKRLTELRDYFYQELQRISPEPIINGNVKHKIANNVHFSIPGQDNEALLFKLDQQNILAAAGSACSASSLEPSHVLGAIGLSDELARSSIRMTLGRGTNKRQLRETIKVLSQII